MVSSLAGSLRAPVRDRTGLTGLFDYNVLFERERNNSELSDAPPLTTAIQQELGLKLESTRTSVEVLTIDHVEKPTSN